MFKKTYLYFFMSLCITNVYTMEEDLAAVRSRGVTLTRSHKSFALLAMAPSAPTRDVGEKQDVTPPESLRSPDPEETPVPAPAQTTTLSPFAMAAKAVTNWIWDRVSPTPKGTQATLDPAPVPALKKPAASKPVASGARTKGRSRPASSLAKQVPLRVPTGAQPATHEPAVFHRYRESAAESSPVKALSIATTNGLRLIDVYEEEPISHFMIRHLIEVSWRAGIPFLCAIITRRDGTFYATSAQFFEQSLPIYNIGADKIARLFGCIANIEVFCLTCPPDVNLNKHTLSTADFLKAIVVPDFETTMLLNKAFNQSRGLLLFLKSLKPNDRINFLRTHDHHGVRPKQDVPLEPLCFMPKSHASAERESKRC